MKKLLALLLCLLFISFPVLAEEEEDNSGTVHVLTDNEETEFAEEGECEAYIPPERYSRAIFGADDRVTVDKTDVFPFSAIAYMKVHATCGCNWECSGFMVRRKCLMTAAHCMVCADHGAWADRIDFMFGYKNGYCAYKYCKHWEAWAGDLFRNGYDNANDYAVVHFDEAVGDKVGWFGICYGYSDSYIADQYLTVAGYRDGKLKYDRGYAQAIDSNLIGYTIDMLSGNSGCPVFDEDYYVVAINVSHNEYTNHGHRITDQVYRTMTDNNYLD